MKVAITCRQMVRDLESVGPELDAFGYEVAPVEVEQGLAGNQLVKALRGCAGVIAGDDVFDRYVLEHCPALKVICKWGVGVDGIDMAAARARGIAVVNTPGAFDEEVADVALGYLVMMARSLHLIDGKVREGFWPKPVGTSLSGGVLGLVGLGGTGRALAKRGQVLGMEMVGLEPDPEKAASAEQLGVEVASAIEEMLPRADFLSLHCPLTSDTHHMLGPAAFASMRRGMILVNTARGKLIDENALIEALRTGTVAKAALDVFEEEPLARSSPLRDFDEVLLGSHNASNTWEACARTHRQAINALAEALPMEAS